MEKADLPVRWVILVLACVMMIGNYYCYDNPSALKPQLQTHMKGANTNTPYDTNFALLYTVYSIPNMVLPFFGGYFVDKLGAPLCLLVFASFILAGQTLFAFGASIESWPVMLAGRVVFGLGGENLTVAQSALLAQWFKGKELAFAFGINLSISRLGSVINDFVSPAVANSAGTTSSLFLGSLICAGSLVTAILITPIDKAAEAKIEKSKSGNEDLNASLLEDSAAQSKIRANSKDSNRGSFSETKARSASSERLSSLRLSNSVVGKQKTPVIEEDAEEINLSDVKNFGVIFWLLSLSCLVVYGCVLPFNNVASGILNERNYFKSPSDNCELTYPMNCTDGLSSLVPIGGNPEIGSDCTTNVNYQPVVPTDINEVCPEGKTCSEKSYNIDNIDPVDIDCDDDFWSKYCTKDFCKKKADASEKSAQVMSIPYFLSAGISPILGFIVDKIGFRAMIATLAPVMLIFVHSALAFTAGSPILPLVGQGVAYSLFAAVLWPSVPFSVEEKSIGTAYGLITAIQNSGLAGFPLIVSSLYNAAGEKYIPNVEIFFVMCACCGLVVGILLNIMDARRGGLLNAKMVPKEQGDDCTSEHEEYSAIGGAAGPPTPLLQT